MLYTKGACGYILTYIQDELYKMREPRAYISFSPEMSLRGTEWSRNHSLDKANVKYQALEKKMI